MVLPTDHDRLHCWREAGACVGRGRVCRGDNGGAKQLIAGGRWQSPALANPAETQRHALAVQDYESRALPLSYGGGGAKVSDVQAYPVPMATAGWCWLGAWQMRCKRASRSK